MFNKATVWFQLFNYLKGTVTLTLYKMVLPIRRKVPIARAVEDEPTRLD